MQLLNTLKGAGITLTVVVILDFKTLDAPKRYTLNPTSYGKPPSQEVIPTFFLDFPHKI